jgi:hypothetical protein
MGDMNLKKSLRVECKPPGRKRRLFRMHLAGIRKKRWV